MNDRLLIISSKTKPAVGGVENVVHFLAKGLAKNGLDVYVLTNIYRHNSVRGFIKYLASKPLDIFKSVFGLGSYRICSSYRIVENYMIFGGISFTRSLFSIFLFLPSLFLFFFKLLIIQPGAINIHFADNSIIYGILAKILIPNRKLIVSLHGSDVEQFPQKSKLQLILLINLLRLADNVVVVSKSLKVSLLDICPNAKNKIKIIPNGIEDFWFEPVSDCNPLEINNYILYVGRLEWNKGVDLLIKAFYKMDSSNLELRIVGVGTKLNSLQDLTRKLGLESRVHFMGTLGQSEIKKLYNDAVFVVMPSRSESFGIVALESMASESVLLGSNIGGLKDLITDGETGYLFESENIDDLTEKMEFLLSDTFSGVQIVKRAKSFVSKFYRQDSVIKQYLDVIKS